MVALIASGGPIGPDERAAQQMRHRVRGRLARNVPALNAIQLAAMRRTGPARLERSPHRDLAATPETKHAALRIEYAAVAEALRPGTRATVQELALVRRQWTFPLSEVRTPVHLWHGAADRNAPIAFARHLAAELPNATLHVSDTAIVVSRDETMRRERSRRRRGRRAPHRAILGNGAVRRSARYLS